MTYLIKCLLIALALISIGAAVLLGCSKSKKCPCERWNKFANQQVNIKGTYSGSGLSTAESDFRDHDTDDNLDLLIKHAKITSIDCEALRFMVTLDGKPIGSDNTWNTVEHSILCSGIHSIKRDRTSSPPSETPPSPSE